MNEEQDQEQYETDAEPKPKHGDRGMCAICHGEIEYFDPIVHSNGGWYHVLNVAHHVAELGGPA